MDVHPVNSFLDAFPTDYDHPIMDHLDQKSLYRLSWTCTDLHVRVAQYMNRVLTIKRLLGGFLMESEWDSFRYLQLVTGMVISGSAALHFLDRATAWVPSDMDLYVEHAHALTVVTWLESRGFQYTLSPHQPLSTTMDIALGTTVIHNQSSEYDTLGAVLNFTRGKVKIQVITARSSPVLGCILGFHSTGVMNLITYDKAYCLHPNTTLGHRLTLIKNDMSTDRMRMASIKYHSRGWDVAVSLPRSCFGLSNRMQDKIMAILENLVIQYRCPGGPDRLITVDVEFLEERRYLFPEGLRRVGDASTWTYRLPKSKGFDSPSVSLIEANTWNFTFDVFRRTSLSFYKLIGDGLEFGYAVGTMLLHREIKRSCKGAVWRKFGPKRDTEVHETVVNNWMTFGNPRMWYPVEPNVVLDDELIQL